MNHAFNIEDSGYELGLSRAASGYRLHLGDNTVPVNLHLREDGSALLDVAGVSHRVYIATRGDDVFVHIDGAAYQLRYEDPLARLAHQAHGSVDDSVRAPMPGSVVAVNVNAGDSVTRGQNVLVIESMKMETTLAAPRDGVVENVLFAVGQTFDRDALLLALAPETAQ
jgi:3-methylcrotonyl-CoA carboxylase alpha subunit